MVRQIVMIRWADTAPADADQQVTEAMLRLRDVMPQILDMRMGADARIRPDNFDYAVTVDFASLSDYLEYRDDPRHWEVVDDVIMPIMGERAGVVFEWPER